MMTVAEIIAVGLFALFEEITVDLWYAPISSAMALIGAFSYAHWESSSVRFYLYYCMWSKALSVLKNLLDYYGYGLYVSRK